MKVQWQRHECESFALTIGTLWVVPYSLCKGGRLFICFLMQLNVTHQLHNATSINLFQFVILCNIKYRC